MTSTGRYLGQDLVERLSRREALRPRIGVRASFFARFGLEDPWGDPLDSQPSGSLLARLFLPTFLQRRGFLFGLGGLGLFRTLLRLEAGFSCSLPAMARLEDVLGSEGGAPPAWLAPFGGPEILHAGTPPGATGLPAFPWGTGAFDLPSFVYVLAPPEEDLEAGEEGEAQAPHARAGLRRAQRTRGKRERLVATVPPVQTGTERVRRPTAGLPVAPVPPRRRSVRVVHPVESAARSALRRLDATPLTSARAGAVHREVPVGPAPSASTGRRGTGEGAVLRFLPGRERPVPAPARPDGRGSFVAFGGRLPAGERPTGTAAGPSRRLADRAGHVGLQPVMASSPVFSFLVPSAEEPAEEELAEAAPRGRAGRTVRRAGEQGGAERRDRTRAAPVESAEASRPATRISRPGMVREAPPRAPGETRHGMPAQRPSEPQGAAPEVGEGRVAVPTRRIPASLRAVTRLTPASDLHSALDTGQRGLGSRPASRVSPGAWAAVGPSDVVPRILARQSTPTGLSSPARHEFLTPGAADVPPVPMRTRRQAEEEASPLQWRARLPRMASPDLLVLRPAPDEPVEETTGPDAGPRRRPRRPSPRGLASAARRAVRGPTPTLRSSPMLAVLRPEPSSGPVPVETEEPLPVQPRPGAAARALRRVEPAGNPRSIVPRPVHPDRPDEDLPLLSRSPVGRSLRERAIARHLVERVRTRAEAPVLGSAPGPVDDAFLPDGTSPLRSVAEAFARGAPEPRRITEHAVLSDLTVLLPPPTDEPEEEAVATVRPRRRRPTEPAGRPTRKPPPRPAARIPPTARVATRWAEQQGTPLADLVSWQEMPGHEEPEVVSVVRSAEPSRVGPTPHRPARRAGERLPRAGEGEPSVRVPAAEDTPTAQALRQPRRLRRTAATPSERPEQAARRPAAAVTEPVRWSATLQALVRAIRSPAVATRGLEAEAWVQVLERLPALAEAVGLPVGRFRASTARPADIALLVAALATPEEAPAVAGPRISGRRVRESRQRGPEAALLLGLPAEPGSEEAEPLPGRTAVRRAVRGRTVLRPHLRSPAASRSTPMASAFRRFQPVRAAVPRVVTDLFAPPVLQPLAGRPSEEASSEAAPQARASARRARRNLARLLRSTGEVVPGRLLAPVQETLRSAAERSGAPDLEAVVGGAGDPVRGLLVALARTRDPEQVLRIILEGAESLHLTSLSAPVAELVAQVQGRLVAEDAHRAEPQGPAAVGLGEQRRPRRSQGTTRPRRSGWAAPSATALLRQATAGPERIMKLVRRLQELIHLVEVKHRLMEARSQVRMASEPPPTPVKGGGRETFLSEQRAAQDLEALTQEVASVINRELGHWKERRAGESEDSYDRW